MVLFEYRRKFSSCIFWKHWRQECFPKLTLCQPLTWGLAKLRPNEGIELGLEQEALSSECPEITPAAHPPLLLCCRGCSWQGVPAASLGDLFTLISEGKCFLISLSVKKLIIGGLGGFLKIS